MHVGFVLFGTWIEVFAFVGFDHLAEADVAATALIPTLQAIDGFSLLLHRCHVQWRRGIGTMFAPELIED